MSDIKSETPIVLTDPPNGQVTHANDRAMEAVGEVERLQAERDPRAWGQEYNAQAALADVLEPPDDRPRSPRPLNTTANFTHRISQPRGD